MGVQQTQNIRGTELEMTAKSNVVTSIKGGNGVPPEPQWSLHYSDELDVAAAQDEWGVIVREMETAETLAVANASAIRRLVMFRIQFERAANHVAEHGAILKPDAVDKVVDKGKPKSKAKVGQWNPYWSVMRQADGAIRALEAELGLAPRRRATAAKAKRQVNRGRPADDYLSPSKR
ncbi:MAG: P27 family phage terminase small subunit [Alphaproteobacteria bacterium]|nr:P27 family phage terminase small subunit [Alphaproteobacteria bacterium]